MSQNKKEPMNNNRIKEVRLSQHKTQKDLANLLGVSEQAIAYYEKALREPPLRNWIKLSDYLNVSVPYLQGVSNIKNKKALQSIEEFAKELNIPKGKHRMSETEFNEMLNFGSENFARAFVLASKIFTTQKYGFVTSKGEKYFQNLESNIDIKKAFKIISPTADVFKIFLNASANDEIAMIACEEIKRSIGDYNLRKKGMKK